MRLNHSSGSLFGFCKKLMAFAVLTVLLIVSSPTQAQNVCSRPSFAPVVAYPSNGNYLTSIVSGDFNGDGEPDLAIAFDLVHDDVGVLLGKGDGSFGDIVKYQSGGVGGVSSIAIGDFNSDHKADLVVASYGGTIGVLLGNGAGGFANATTFPSGGYSPRSLVVGDFNIDGKADVAVAHFGIPSDYSGSVAVLLGKGDGDFEEAVGFSSGGRGAQSIVAGDFNKDSKPDLIVANYYDGTIGTLLGKGDGSFAKAITFPTSGTGGRSIAVGDFDKNGNLDLAIVHVLTGGLSMLTGDGTGNFVAKVVDAGEGVSLQSVSAADVNSDGNLDLVTANNYLFSRDSVAVLLGNGTGNFAKAVAFPVDGINPNAVVINDFNKDEKPDVITANFFIDATVDVLLNNCGKPMAVSDFTLVNTTTNQDIQPLKDGDVVDITNMPRTGLTVRANPSTANVSSVVFELKGDRNYKHTENGVPFALFGDNKTDYIGGGLQAGDYTLTATPYRKGNGKGAKGTPLTVHFKVVYSAAITRFTLVDARTGKDINELKEGDEINLAAPNTKQVSIRAATSPDTVGSVVFALSGQQTHRQIENLLPYSLFGDKSTTYTPWALPVGNYTLTATTYSTHKGAGAKGKTHTVHFSVSNLMPCFTPCMTAPVVSKEKQTFLSVTEQSQVHLGASPNPFIKTTRIQYRLPAEASLSIKVYDVLGREVSTVFNGQRSAGTYTVDYITEELSKGVYYCRMLATTVEGKNIVQTIKLVKQSR